MRPRFSTSRFWFMALGVVILIVGLAAAWYVRTQAHADAAPHYRLVGGQVYLEQSEDSKQDADAVERYGGTVAVIGAAYKRKFHDLLHGDKLAYGLVIAAVILAGFCFRAAWDPDGHDGD